MYSAEDIRSLIEFEDTLNAQDAINFLEGLVKDIEEKEAHDTETIKSRFDPENLSIIKELVDSILYIQDIVGHSEGKVICDITGWRYAFKDEPEVLIVWRFIGTTMGLIIILTMKISIRGR